MGNKFYLVFPLCTGGELYEHVIRKGHFTEYDAAVLMRDLISALHELHQHDILHLDIKPENILFESDAPDARIKITDFGLSKVGVGLTGSGRRSHCFSGYHHLIILLYRIACRCINEVSPVLDLWNIIVAIRL